MPCHVWLTQVTNLRLKGTMPGEGAHVKLNSIFYLSVHTLDGADGFRYAKNRVSRDLLDLWLEKKISFGGITFDDACDVLTEEDTRIGIVGLRHSSTVICLSRSDLLGFTV